jgi:hypothetical protein
MAIEIVSGVLQNVFRILAASWWIVLPFVLWLIFLNFWLMAIRKSYILKIPWKLLEVKIPREILKTPKAMEQVFAAVHATHSDIKFFDKWWKGKVPDWFSFELVGSAGRVHFYVRVAEQFRNLVESAIYAQYPDTEIVEVPEDYISLLPSVLPNRIYDLWGTNFILAREDAYPIRTYEYFEAREKEKRLDPIAGITETISKLKEDEMIWIQILARAAGDKWKKEGEKLVAKLAGKKIKSERTLMEDLGIFLGNLIKAPVTPPVWPDEEKSEGPKSEIGSLTPGEKDVVAAVENKISKLGFESAVRFVYIDKAASFTRANVSAVLGALRQFSTQNLNAFKPDGSVTTKANFPFKAQKIYYRKRRIFDGYKLRIFPKKFSILNTEELATVYHFPTTFVEAPTLQRLESRRGEPPAELPIE